VMALDGDEPIAPLTLRISTDGITLRRNAMDNYPAPFLDVAALGQFPASPAAPRLRRDHGLPERITDATGQPTPQMRAHLDAAKARLRAAIAEAEDETTRRMLTHRLNQIDGLIWPFGAVVAWRLQLTGSEATALTPDGIPAPVTDSPWWLELLSTGFDQDAGCALLRGVLHAPLTNNPGPPPWTIPLQPPGPGGPPPMPTDAMGVRPGR
jgi:hypothetical protein